MTSTNSQTSGVILIRAIVLSAIILGIIATINVQAQDKGGLRVAIFNSDKAIADYKFAKTSRESLQKLDSDAKTTLEIFQTYPFLDTKEQDDFAKLEIKSRTKGAELNAGEKMIVEKLKSQHSKMVTEYSELLGKPNGAITAQDTAKIEQFNKRKNDTEARIRSTAQNAQKAIEDAENEANLKIDKDVRDKMIDTAKAKNVNVVFSSRVVFYAEVDITDDVVKALNK